MTNSTNIQNQGTIASIQQASQHKRSQSFNHHLSYNQYSNQNAIGNTGTFNLKQSLEMNLAAPLREKVDQPAAQNHQNAKINSKGNRSRLNEIIKPDRKWILF